MDIDTKERVAEIRRLNEQFRTTFHGGKILLTASVAALPDMAKASALEKVATFKAFNEENDPHQERDYGSFDHCDREFWFKIDYYNLTMDTASEDPADPEKTKRIMTVGLAQDWYPQAPKSGGLFSSSFAVERSFKRLSLVASFAKMSASSSQNADDSPSICARCRQKASNAR